MYIIVKEISLTAHLKTRSAYNLTRLPCCITLRSGFLSSSTVLAQIFFFQNNSSEEDLRLSAQICNTVLGQGLPYLVFQSQDRD